MTYRRVGVSSTITRSLNFAHSCFPDSYIQMLWDVLAVTFALVCSVAHALGGQRLSRLAINLRDYCLSKVSLERREVREACSTECGEQLCADF
jgi:hypothetical protein